MSGKPKDFPLDLSRVMGGSREKRHVPDADYRLKEIAPQTAVRNMVKSPVPVRTERKRPDLPPAGLPAASKNRVSPLRGAIALAEKVAALGIGDTMVLSAISMVPRHLFVEPALASQAYEDTSLPIGHKQTISRPYTVARMIEAARTDADGRRLTRILEIGTGCGYQAAVLSHLAKEVYSIERIEALHELAKNNLRQLRIPNLRLHYGDGMSGLPQVAPFDAILIAAASQNLPEALFLQLAIGGYMVAPVGNEKQTLQLTKRIGERRWQSVTLEDCHFVPLLQGVEVKPKKIDLRLD